MSARLSGRALTLGYQRLTVTHDLDVHIPDGSFTVLVGANGCGKSTLLRALARALEPQGGAVFLDGAAMSSLPAKQIARQLGLLPQGPVAPDGITVADLVARGRYPHQRMLRQWSRSDDAAVAEAMVATDVEELADRYVGELSGGQRQRVWLALALAQQTSIMLLDEPTTFLDIAHQVDVLDLCSELHLGGRTLVAVLHDVNLACRYATQLIAMAGGRIVAQGAPCDIVDAALIEQVFGLSCRIIPDPETGTPLVVPTRRTARGAEPRVLQVPATT